jgi:hypothetical protein
MRESILDTLADLLKFLRSYEVLEETQGSKFRLAGKDFAHLHDDSDGLWADAILSKDRIPVSVGQRELMDAIGTKLDSLESHSERGTKRRARRIRRDT